MNILITGGAGFIGSNLALALQERGHNLTIVDNLSSGNLENLKDFSGKLIEGDVTQKKLFAQLKKEKYEVIFHEASITDTTYSDSQKMIYDNVEGFKNILDFANDCGAKLIYASSAAVYGNGHIPAKENQKLFPLNAYAVSKFRMDKIVRRPHLLAFSHALDRMKRKQERRNSTMSIIGLRYFNVYGPGEKYKGKSSSMIWQLAQKIKKGEEPLRIFKYGEQSRDHIYVKDVVEANIKAMESENSGIFNIGTGKLTTFNKIIEILNKVFVTAKRPEYFDNPYNFYQNRTQADTTLAFKILKWKSQFSIEEGIKDYFR